MSSIKENPLLTWDELTVDGPSYSVQYQDGKIFILGKLTKREKFLCPFHGQRSLYNNIFKFENKPDFKEIGYNEENFHNKAIFLEIATP